MKAIGYIRVSTQEQAKEGISLENQEQKIKTYCKLNDFELIKIFKDAGYSGKNTKRPALQQALNLVIKKEIDGIIIYKLDRLSRKVKDITDMTELFEKKNIGFHSVIDKLDTKTAMGKFFLNMMASISQLERDTISERTKDALQMKKSKGERIGTLPFGFKLGENKIILIKDEREQAIIKRIRDLKKNNYSYQIIAEKLNTEGWKTRRGNEFKRQNIWNIFKSAN